MENVLGIDLGGKFVGLAVVRQPDNLVLWCGTLHLSDKIKDLYDLRRVLRRARRSRVRYRKPKVPQRGGGASGSGADGATYFYRRAKGLNQSLRTKCKHVDPQTGEVCGKNTPRAANVRHLLLEDILGFEPFKAVPESYRQALLEVLAATQGTPRKQQRLKNILAQVDVDSYLKKQVIDIICNDLDGRCEFCRDHLLAHHQQTAVPRQAYWLPPSIKLKQDFLLKHVRQLARRFDIDKIVIERARFDLQKIAAGVIDDPAEYQQGSRFGFRNTRAALLQEYDGRCCYCGKEVFGQKWHVDHVQPRRQEQVDRWDNLAIACEKCNHLKGGRDPEEAGMSFAVVTVKAAGRPIKRSLAPRPIEGSRIHKYMTQTDQGIRMLKSALGEFLPAKPIEETFGYVTSAWRQFWGLEKGKDSDEHHNDAIVIAAARQGPAVPTMQNQPETLEQVIGGRRLFDLNPVGRDDQGRYHQRMAARSDMGGIARRQLKAVPDPHKRALLEREFERHAVKGQRPLPPSALSRLPFRGVRLLKRDCTDSNVRLMRTGHRFKLSNSAGNAVNEAVAVYRGSDGRLGSYAVKNRKAFGPTLPPENLARELTRFRHGEPVWDKDGRALGIITKLASDGILTIRDGDGKAVSRAGHLCRKSGINDKQ
jgi:hypothetical protein